MFFAKKNKVVQIKNRQIKIYFSMAKVEKNSQKNEGSESNFERVGESATENNSSGKSSKSNANPITICKAYLQKYEIRENKTLGVLQWKVDEQYTSTNPNSLYIHLRELGMSINKSDLNAILASDFVATYREPTVEREHDEQAESEPFISPIGMIESYLLSKYDFRYNLVRLSNEFKEKSQVDFLDFEKRDRSNLFIELKKNAFKVTLTDLDALLESRDFAKDYHPFKLYFENLPKWNGKVDYFRKLASYMTFIDESEKERFILHLKKHFIRIIKQALEHKYFNKQCFVFIGSQSDGKTYLTRWFYSRQIRYKILY